MEVSSLTSLVPSMGHYSSKSGTAKPVSQRRCKRRLPHSLKTKASEYVSLVNSLLRNGERMVRGGQATSWWLRRRMGAFIFSLMMRLGVRRSEKGLLRRFLGFDMGPMMFCFSFACFVWLSFLEVDQYDSAMMTLSFWRLLRGFCPFNTSVFYLENDWGIILFALTIIWRVGCLSSFVISKFPFLFNYARSHDQLDLFFCDDIRRKSLHRNSIVCGCIQMFIYVMRQRRC